MRDERSRSDGATSGDPQTAEKGRVDAVPCPEFVPPSRCRLRIDLVGGERQLHEKTTLGEFRSERVSGQEPTSAAALHDCGGA